VAGVVPAFFSPNRSRVVYEIDREILVVDLATRQVHSIGPGIAPRVVPFSESFVFLREIPELRQEQGEVTQLHYSVFRGSFRNGEAELIGTTTAVARTGSYGNYSAVRWMVVGETPEGFALRGYGVTDFPLPAGAARPRASSPRSPQGGTPQQPVPEDRW